MLGLGIQTTFEPQATAAMDDKASSGLPSPTLTNPDMVLPTDDNNHSADSPPTPNYTHGSHGWSKISAAPPISSTAGSADRVRLGPRNMILLGSHHLATSTTYASSQAMYQPHASAHDKSDTASVSSISTEDMASLPAYLAKYKTQRRRINGNPDQDNDELSDTDTTVAPTDDETSVSVIENGVEEDRREQQKHERASAILSQRAEQILANAKQRLTLMEGNLRGARDLVAPLTAANLKRATSMHSGYPSRNSFLQDKFSNPQPTLRTLQGQSSSPSMNRDFYGHARGFSETKVPERSSTSFAKSSRNGRIPINVNVSWNQGVRASKSFDSIGNSASQLPLTPKNEASDANNLEPVREGHETHSPDSHSRDGSILSTTSSTSATPEHLRSQMTNLHEKIATLNERAKEDRLKRQSLRSSKTPSPFNNTSSTQSELFYEQSEGYESPVFNTTASIAWTSSANDPIDSPSFQKSLHHPDPSIGSRNAFAEQSAHDQHYSSGQGALLTPLAESDSKVVRTVSNLEHKHNPSSTALVESATKRYSYYQRPIEQESTSYLHDDSEYDRYSDIESSLDNESGVMGHDYLNSRHHDFDGEMSTTDGDSVYEDVEGEPFAQPVVAHEDRHDAFDYENFFLHSAMGSFSNGRRTSTSSEGSSSSVETARNPNQLRDHIDDEDDEYSNPRTPERLREIERNLHRRAESSDSINTLATFATAAEHRQQTPTLSDTPDATIDWPIQPVNRSRPGTAIGMTSRRHLHGRNAIDSDRSDSGVVLPKRPNSVHDLKRRSVLRARSSIGMLVNTPISPTTPISDPATVAVTALLNPSASSQLGLRDKALLFGVVESLRKVCASLQEHPNGQQECQLLRQRLEEAKQALDGLEHARPEPSAPS